MRPLVLLHLCAAIAYAAPVAVGDWPEMRGPTRDGRSVETGLVEKWSLKGENLAWKASFGGRSAPAIVGDHLYLFNTAGAGETLQERLVCLNADTGKLLWERRFNIYQSDVPPHRVAWASPAADPATGNVFILGGGGSLRAFTKDGKLLWERSLGEDFDLFTTHGGRTVSPLLDGNLVILSAASSTWGTHANRAIRFMAFDKATGSTVWVSSPGGRPYDTSYAQPVIVNVNGVRLLISGSGDGAIHAMKAQTGEPVWHFAMSKRAINTAAVPYGNSVFVSNGQENLEGNVMGQLARLDATLVGNVPPEKAVWSVKGFIGEFSAGVVDGDRFYQVDNGSNLFAFDGKTGKELWKQNLGTVQKAALVFADGKLYVGTESGKFFILRPSQTRCEVLSEVELPLSDQGLASAKTPEPVLASAAVSRGRVYFVSTDTIYALGNKKAGTGTVEISSPGMGSGPAKWVQVSPTELTVTAGQSVQLKARLFDEKGEFLREDKAEWSLEGLKGTAVDGKYTAPASTNGEGGLVKATVGGVTGAARVRVVPALPWNETFESYAVGATPPYWSGAVAGKYTIQDLDGSKVVAKAPDQTLFKRMRVFIGPSDWSNYTIEADVRAPERRRQLGDVGITGQRYTLVLYGGTQKLELFSWQPETTRTVSIPFAWKADTWYHLKLRVENTADGKTRTLGKAWLKSDPEPTKWMIDRVDPIPNRAGSPGIFGDATFGTFYDNIRVTPN